jgi:hypothetical protein
VLLIEDVSRHRASASLTREVLPITGRSRMEKVDFAPSALVASLVCATLYFMLPLCPRSFASPRSPFSLYRLLFSYLRVTESLYVSACAMFIAV